MTQAEQAFPSRLLKLGNAEALGAAGAVNPAKINQHIENLPDGRGVMDDAEAERVLQDPFATLVLKRGIFPRTLVELLAAIAQHDATPEGLPGHSNFVVSEGGQIAFAPGVDKGGTRLITVRFRGTSPELMIQTLLPPGTPTTSQEVLIEVIAWDPVNKTLHFYQRQSGGWFWCGQSDMALEEPTRGHGPFDSHINGYPVMKELKTPWVHWHGPGLRIAETAYAPDDPLLRDPLFTERDHALNFEEKVVRPLIDRWNRARFDKAIQGETVTAAPRFLAQLLESTSANLISTHTEWSRIDSTDLKDLPPTFFFDQDCLVSAVGLGVQTPPLSMTGARYRALVKKYNLRVRGGTVDQAGDVPFCFTVPERAREDVVVVRDLIQRRIISKRLAACLLMVDFSNPVGSPRRAALMKYVPPTAKLSGLDALDELLPKAILASTPASKAGTPEAEFKAHWELGPDGWQDAFADRLEAFHAKVVEQLASDGGCDAIFRLAESRRRDFRRRPLAEFGLTLPQAVGIPENEPRLEMTADASVRPLAPQA